MAAEVDMDGIELILAERDLCCEVTQHQDQVFFFYSSDHCI